MISPPTILNVGVLNSFEGCSSISDAAGNLLFYTNGVTVWNRFHVVMTNGTGLQGDPHATQSALILKQPGNANIYYIFTLDSYAGANGLRYSIVDISLSGGNGSVIIKNTLLFTPSTERLTATRHCNGTDIWIVSHDWNSSNFRSYLLTATGLSSIPVISSVGTTHTGSNNDAIGGMKISPNGKKLGLSFSGVPRNFELYDFNATTGIVSNPLILATYGAGTTPYGLEFSPDGTKFYGATNNGSSVLTQWNLCAGSNPAIITSSFAMAGTELGQLQLAPNGKIYIARGNFSFGPQTSLGVINNPNLTGAGCNFVNLGQSVAPATSLYGLPNILLKMEPPPFSFTTACTNASFTMPAGLTVPGCPSAGFSLIGQVWDFGDPGSGSANTSGLPNPVHGFSASGSFTTQLVLYYNCGGTDTLKKVVTVGTPAVQSGTSICSGQTTTLTAPPGALSYTWNTGAFSTAISVSPSVTTAYTVNSTATNGCVNTTVHTVTVFPSPPLVILGKDSVCYGSEVLLNATGADSYTWSTGTLGAVLSQTPTFHTTYTVTGINNSGCVSQKTVNIVLLYYPNISVSGTTHICPGASSKMTAFGASNYTWSTGATGSVTTISPAITNTYALMGKGQGPCVNRITFYIVLHTLPKLEVNSPTICPGASATLSLPADPTVKYTWYPGAVVGSTVTVNPLTSQTYTLIANSAGCFTQTTTRVTILDLEGANLNFSYPTTCQNKNEIFPIVGSGFLQGGSFYSDPLVRIDPNNGVINLSEPIRGTFKVFYDYSGGECPATVTSTANVTILPAPDISVSGNTIIPDGASAPLSVTGFTSYSWDNSDYLSCNDCTDPIATPPETAQFCVTSVLGSCTTKTCVTVEVTCEIGDLSVPNAFTPNGDGLNDEFCLQGWVVCISDFQVSIYNRWGEKLFESDQHDFCWNGVYKGRLLPKDVYTYVITAKRKTTAIRRMGNISLIR